MGGGGGGGEGGCYCFFFPFSPIGQTCFYQLMIMMADGR